MSEALQKDQNAAVHLPRSWLGRLCTFSAGVGGVVIFLSALMVTVSVVMRVLGVGGIRGDFEAVELVCAACASLFLPLCQYTKGHVIVDLFTLWMPAGGQRRLDGVWTVVMGITWALVAWYLFHGMLMLRDYGDRTMLLGVPVWIVYIPAIFGMALSSVVAVLTGLPMISTSLRALEGRK